MDERGDDLLILTDEQKARVRETAMLLIKRDVEPVHKRQVSDVFMEVDSFIANGQWYGMEASTLFYSERVCNSYGYTQIWEKNRRNPTVLPEQRWEFQQKDP